MTLSLKNLSQGLVNNVSRAHVPELRFIDFISAVVNMPVIRRKTVLNILDGTKGVCHGGPGVTERIAKNYVWDHKAIYFATDPVALDVIGRSVIEQQRKLKGLWPLAEKRTDDIWTSPKRQPQYIESCGKAGLGECDPDKIEFKPIKIG